MPASPRRSSASGCGCSPTTAAASPGTWSTRRFEPVGDEEQFGPEGCLSIPGMSWDCRRHLHVVARGFDMYGEPVTVEGSEILARCIQHEVDHLDGVLFVDRLDPETRKQAMAEIRSAEWFGAPGTRPAAGEGQPAPAVREGRGDRCASGDGRVRHAAAPAVRRHPGGGGAVAAGAARLPARGRGRADPAGRARRARAAGGPLAGRGAGRRGRDPGAHPAAARRARSSSTRCARSPPTAARSSPTARSCPAPRWTCPRYGWVNLHFSLLPAWRGAAPVQAAVRHGDEITGATTFRLEEGLDTGPVYGVVTEAVAPTDTAGDLLGRLAVSGAALLAATIDGIADGTLVPAAAARRGRLARPEGHRRGRAGRLGGARRGRRPARPLRRPRTPARGRPSAASGWGSARCGPPTPPTRPSSSPASCTSRSGGCWSARRPAPVVLGEVRPVGRRPMPAADWARGVRITAGEVLA